MKKLVFLGVLNCCFLQNAIATTAEFKFDEAQYRQDVKTLASDKFGGRSPLSEGEKLTLDYLVATYKKLGLEPGYKGSYLQPVPVAKITPDPNINLRIGDVTYTNGDDFTARTQQLSKQINLSNSDVVFVGYGIKAPEYHWNDYKNVDVKGKTVVVLVNDPGFATQNDKLFTGNAMTYYGRWTYKYEEAARQGAAAVLIVHETAPAAYGWGVVRNSNAGSKFTLFDDESNQSQVAVMGWIQKQTADNVFEQAGFNFDVMKQKALGADFKAVDLKLTANLTLKNTIEKAQSYNVIAKLSGTSKSNDTLVMHAHWDHLGSVVDAKGKKHIYNGAVDNASGVAGILQLARYFKQSSQKSPFKRDILFANFTAEETGLIGAQQFAKQPPVPAKDIVSFLNIDGMNVNQSVDYILRYGNGVSELERYLAKAAKSQQRFVKPDPRPQNGLFFRSDHFALAQAGVPGLLYMSLGDTDPDYIANKYHKEADTYDVNWKLGGVKQDLELISEMLERLANNDDWPHWLEASEFKNKRELDGRK